MKSLTKEGRELTSQELIFLQNMLKWNSLVTSFSTNSGCYKSGFRDLYPTKVELCYVSNKHKKIYCNLLTSLPKGKYHRHLATLQKLAKENNCDVERRIQIEEMIVTGEVVYQGYEMNLSHDLQEIYENPDISTTTKKSLIDARIGQGKFRKKLIAYWKKCPLTECDEISILRASHIKPWKDSSSVERLDPFNGVLLAPNIDSLFDKGLISFKNDGTIIKSEQISKKNLERLWLSQGIIQINFEVYHFPYLEWHRNFVFKK